MASTKLIELLAGDDPIAKELFSSSTAKEYLKFLTTASIDDIKKIPQELSQEMVRMEKEWLSVTCNDYKSFLHAHKHLYELNQQIVKVPTLLKSLNDYIPSIEEQLISCQKQHKDSLSNRQTLNSISNQLDTIEPILEIPILFNTLIRNNHYEEAMDLQLFTQRLPHRYPEVPFFKKLATIRASTQAMLNQLFAMLRGPAKLPLCIRVIGYLRRLGFPDSTLRLLFLFLRYEYLKSLLDLVKEPNGHEYVRRWIEIQREHLFDIVAHYKAIFPPTSSTTSEDLQILTSFVLEAVTNLMDVVKKFLDTVTDLAVLPPLNTQIMYYGMSLGRIGMDFRLLFVGLFEDVVKRVVQGHFQAASLAFDTHSVTKIERPRTKNMQAMLMVFNPIGVCFNHYMNGLNQLRYLPCKSIHSDLSQLLIQSLDSMVQKVIQSHPEDKRNCEIIAWILHETLIPTVCNGLDTVLDTRTTKYDHLLASLDHLADAAKPENLAKLGLLSPLSSDSNMNPFSDNSTIPLPIARSPDKSDEINKKE